MVYVWGSVEPIFIICKGASRSRGVETKLLHGSMVENMVIFTALHSTPFHSTPVFRPTI